MKLRDAKKHTKELLKRFKMMPCRSHGSGWNPEFQIDGQWVECVGWQNGPRTYRDCWHEKYVDVLKCWKEFRKEAYQYVLSEYLKMEDSDV